MAWQSQVIATSSVAVRLSKLDCNPLHSTKMATLLKSTATASIDYYQEELGKLSSEIWKHPELGFKEHKAHRFLTDFLEKKGFTVERSYTDIETAFKATFGSGRPNVCVICEYDALPEIGHACGHNLIAEAGVAAGLGVKAVLGSNNAPKGTITIMGTPAEETAGGKLDLIRNGAFDNVDLAMMVHPCPANIISPTLLALHTLEVTYTGKAAHAAAYPWEGVNALDAVMVAYNAISLLRQQMRPNWRVHGVITVGGGEDPAVIPEQTRLKYYIRAPTTLELNSFKERIVRCFQSGAMATGCEVAIKPALPQFNEVANNNPLVTKFASNFRELGIEFKMKEELTLSTDMGNVSYVVPSIHPMYAIGSGEVNHTREFTAVANTPEAHRATLTAAKATAHTCIDVLTTDGLLTEIKKDFDRHVPKLESLA